MAVEQQIFELDVGESLEVIVEDGAELQRWVRVPGGWLLIIQRAGQINQGFVPFSLEGKEGEPMNQICNFSGTIDCPTKADPKCCCFETHCEVLPCSYTAEQFCQFINNLPPYSQVSLSKDFGNDGFVLVWKTPLPGTCEDDPGAGNGDGGS